MSRAAPGRSTKKRVIEDITSRVKTPEEVHEFLHFKEGGTILLIDPHADDSPLALAAQIKAWQKQGYRVVSLVMTPGYTSVSDAYISNLLTKLKGYHFDRNTRLPTLKMVETELAKHTRLRPKYKVDGNWFKKPTSMGPDVVGTRKRP